TEPDIEQSCRAMANSRHHATPFIDITCGFLKMGVVWKIPHGAMATGEVDGVILARLHLFGGEGVGQGGLIHRVLAKLGINGVAVILAIRIHRSRAPVGAGKTNLATSVAQNLVGVANLGTVPAGLAPGVTQLTMAG